MRGSGRAFVVGTAGHVDHGKTALVRALTGVETDRWREEKDRGLSIDLGFAPLEVDADVDAALVDVPGHEDFVTNMLAGATGIDFLLLVVAADEGPMPQTREHLTISRILGIEEGVVALSKADLVDEEWLELAREAVRDELRTVLDRDDWPVMPVSSTEGTGVEEIRRQIGLRAPSLPPRPGADLFRLPVDRSFTVRGAGTVVTGTTWSGGVAEGDTVRVLPLDREVRVRGLQVHGQDRDEVGPGRRCALALVGVDPEEVPRGSTVVTGRRWRVVERLGVRVRIPRYVKRGVEDGQRIRIYLGTREVMARAELREDAVSPGGRTWMRLSLERPLVARVGDRFVLRFYSPVTTIGGGRVVDLEPSGRWWERLDAWEQILEGKDALVLAAAAALRGGEGLSGTEAPLSTGLATEALQRLEEDPPPAVRHVAGRWFHSRALDEIRKTLMEELRSMHRQRRRRTAVSLEELRSAVPDDWDETVVERILEELRAADEIVVLGGRVRLPDHRPSLTDREEAALDEVDRRIAEGGLEPPSPGDLQRELGLDPPVLHDLLDLLLERSRLVALTPDLYLSREVERRLRKRAGMVLERHAPAGPADFKEEFEVSRKYLIPLLEHLDSVGVSRRTPEGRVPGDAGGSRA